jgi:site-specific DNA-methyltransferase (adenine-specific)
MRTDAIYCGDCIETLKSWRAARIPLIFADPPFNIGYVYDRYHDDVPDAEYVKWTRDWMAACKRVLAPDGSFYIAIGDDFAADVRILGRELGLHLRNWIIWHYTFGQNARSMFARSHTHIFYFTKDRKHFKFNDQRLRFPSARHTEYQDLRANAEGRLPNDVWDEFPRVCGTFRERAGFHGCQMPEALLMRIILASSNPGDLVLDPFVGSGTTVAAAKRVGRHYIGIDLSEEYVRHVEERLARIDPAAPLNARDQSGWPALHSEMLMQIYRETKVTLENLLPNNVALRVVAVSLAARAGKRYPASEVCSQLRYLREIGALPKLPNDTKFVPRNHATTEGKRYVRKVFRVRGRKSTAPVAASVARLRAV